MFLIKQSAVGFSNLVARFQPISELLDLHPAIIGISMKWSSSFAESGIGYGEPSIMKARFLIFWYNPGGTRKPQKKLIKSLLKKQKMSPSLIVTYKLRSSHAAFRELRLTAEHIDNKRENNRAENSHQPLRRRERKIQRFKSPGSAQRFLNVHASTYNHFDLQRHLIDRSLFKDLGAAAFSGWKVAALNV